MDYRTPLSRVRGLGSAREGTGHFWRQRMTAVANIPLALFFVVLVASLMGSSQAEVAAAFASPLVAAGLLLLLISVLTHMRLGIQVVIEDYVHGEITKIALLMLNTFYCVALGVACAFALLRLAIIG